MNLILDRAIGLAFYSAIEDEFNGELPVQFPGISNDSAKPTDKEWLAAYLLSINPVTVRTGTIRDGLIQVSCFARFHENAVEKQHDRPWVIADRIIKLLGRKSISIINSIGKDVGCITFNDPVSQYINESDIAKAQVRGFLDPSNIHSVNLTFNFRASTN